MTPDSESEEAQYTCALQLVNMNIVMRAVNRVCAVFT